MTTPPGSEAGATRPDPAGRRQGAVLPLTARSPQWLLLAVVLAVLSLGLPWSHAYGSAAVRIPGWYAAGGCTTNYGDGSMSCTPGFLAPGLDVATSPQGASFGSAARMYVATAVALALIGWRRRARAPFLGAILSLVLSVFVVSRSLTGGAAAVLLAAGCLAVVARRMRLTR